MALHADVFDLCSRLLDCGAVLAGVKPKPCETPFLVRIVERAMHTLTRPSLDPAAVQTAEQLLTDQAPILGPSELHRFAHAVVNAADPDGPAPVDDQLQQHRRHVELTQRRDDMWQLQGKLTKDQRPHINHRIQTAA